MKFAKLLFLISILNFGLSGCAAIVVAGAATTVSAVSDQRTIGSQLDDQSIEFKVGATLLNDESLKSIHFNVVSTKGQLLITGEAPTQALKDKAQEVASGIPGVKSVINQLRISQPSSLISRTHDSWLTTKVKTKLASTKGLSSLTFKVVSENSEVFLIGVVNRQQADLAVDVTRKISGIKRVIKVFQYIK